MSTTTVTTNTPPETTNDVRTNPPQCMSKAEAATYLGVSLRFLNRELERFRLKPTRLGRRVILRLKEIERYLDFKDAQQAT
ncbi:hypothetical protein OpiT1DRAFT_04019 [Opitutaceae bacterium TAV1]|nr:hypothetical protein OpiT1DRAFT_04019 [Opitutaceae bacterium TAV1]